MNDREVMIEYLKLRVRMQDWHGVRDAASDLEVMDAKNPPEKPDCPATLMLS